MKETADKQSSLWGSLILAYCKHHKVGVLNGGRARGWVGGAEAGEGGGRRGSGGGSGGGEGPTGRVAESCHSAYKV